MMRIRHLQRFALDITTSVWPAAVALAAALGFAQPAGAAALAFTFNPNGASPSLAGPGTAFTADAISAGSYLTAVIQPDFSFVSSQYLAVTGFTLNSAPVTAPGFGSSYGLYLEFTATGNEPPGSFTYSSTTLTLKADPGNHDGQLTATANGVGFANTGVTGEADDITLATGSLASAALAFNPATGVRNAHFDLSFSPAAAEAGFFAAPTFGSSVLLDVQLTTPPNTYTATSGPNGTSVNYVNGAFGTVQFVPEPASIAILGVGLAGVVPLRRKLGRFPQI